MSGHYATLLRGTVEAMLPDHDVYITDWADARNVPLAAGRFDFDDFVDYLIDFILLHRPEHTRDGGTPAGRAGAVATAPTARHATTITSLPRSSLNWRPDRHAPQSDEGQRSRRPRITAWFERNVILTVPFPRRRIQTGPSIRASCSSPGP